MIPLIDPIASVNINQPSMPADDYTQTPIHEGAGIRFFKIKRNKDKADEDSIV